MAQFSVDGIEWDIPCDIERISEMKSSNISGMLLNGNYFNDVLGQYLRYTVTLVIPKGYESNYSSLYNILSYPQASHTFVMPYNQTTLTFTGRVQQISDVYVREPNSGFTWRKTRFEAIASTPYRTQSLSDASGEVYSDYSASTADDDLLYAAGTDF